jgi:hypothetical protein
MEAALLTKHHFLVICLAGNEVSTGADAMAMSLIQLEETILQKYN